MLTDEPDCLSSDGNKTKSSINKNTIIPQKLSNEQVCLLYEEFLEDLEDEDRHTCIGKLKQEKITGRTLVKACEDVEVMAQVKKILDFPLEFNLRFEDMLVLIKRRQKELKEDNFQNDQKTVEIPASEGKTMGITKQNISNSECVIGAMHNIGQTQNIYTACKYTRKNKEELDDS